MPTYSATGLVLRRAGLGEADRVVTLFTAEHGKLSAVAKAARRGTSRFAGAAELFTLTRLLLATGKSLDIITQCDIEDSFPALRLDLQLLARAMYMCELLDRLTPERDPAGSKDLLELIVHSLHRLHEPHAGPDIVVHTYEIRLLTTLGYAPTLDSCCACGKALNNDGLAFSALLGGVLCRDDLHRDRTALPLRAESVTLLRALANGTAQPIQRILPEACVADEVARILGAYVRVRTERALKSAVFLDQLRAGLGAADPVGPCSAVQ